MNIHGYNVMFADAPSNSPMTIGNNISLTISSTDKNEIEHLFNSMAKEGSVTMPLAETFWSQLYGCVTDKFGIMWQFSHDDGRQHL